MKKTRNLRSLIMIMMMKIEGEEKQEHETGEIMTTNHVF